MTAQLSNYPLLLHIYSFVIWFLIFLHKIVEIETEVNKLLPIKALQINYSLISRRALQRDRGERVITGRRRATDKIMLNLSLYANMCMQMCMRV